MARSSSTGSNRRVTGKAADSGYDEAKSTVPKLQVQLPNLQNLFQSGASGTGRQVTGKAADSGYTPEKKQASQQANRQIVQNWLNNEQTKSAQDNSTDRAYTAKLTGGANIDNSAEVMKSLQRTFGGVNNSARTQYNRTLQSKMGYGRNWGNPRSAVGNAIESGVAGVVADWLNAAGTALKSDRRSGLAVDSGDVEAKATGKEWYNRAGSYLQKEADWAQMLSENAYLRGSRGLNNAQTLLFDGTVAGTQMAGDIALGTLTGGSATIPMAIRGFGGASQQARQAGATENQQIVYGAANALKEALTEKLFDGLAGAYGKGSADDFVDDLARNLTKSEGGQALVRGLLNTGGEGAEEVISGFVDPALQGIYNGKTLGENYRNLNLNDLLHGGAVGMLLGSLGGVVDIAQTGQDATGRAGLSTPYSDLINATAATENQTANHPDQSRYQELLQKFLDGSIAPQEGAELWRLENIWGQSDTSNQYNTHLAKNPEDRYTQIDPDEENIRQNFGLAERGSEFDTNGNPIFATTREEAAIDGIDYVALKAARKEADAEYGLTDGEAKSLAGYISTTFAMLNKRMYAGTITDKDAGVVERITSALKKFPMFSGTTYRNLKFSNEEMYNNFLSEYAEGNLLTLKAFTSTSKRPNGYPKFGQYTIHMVIEGISGADISSSYGVPRQQEVILLPGTTLKINKVSLANDGSPIIFAQEVSTYGVE